MGDMLLLGLRAVNGAKRYECNDTSDSEGDHHDAHLLDQRPAGIISMLPRPARVKILQPSQNLGGALPRCWASVANMGTTTQSRPMIDSFE